MAGWPSPDTLGRRRPPACAPSFGPSTTPRLRLRHHRGRLRRLRAGVSSRPSWTPGASDRSRWSRQPPRHRRSARLAPASGQFGRLAIPHGSASGAGRPRRSVSQGKGLGGSGAINALAYQRGHPAAYDRWPAGWRYADLLPYFKRAETFSGGASQWRGGDGPLHVLSLADVTDRTLVASAFIEASRELGFPMTPDLGGALATGVGWKWSDIRGHRRDDAATAYLGRLDVRAWSAGVAESVPTSFLPADVSCSSHRSLPVCQPSAAAPRPRPLRCGLPFTEHGESRPRRRGWEGGGALAWP